MVSQPAYLKNLKAYTRRMFGGEEAKESVVADLGNESDKGAVILAATSIEDMLEFALGLRMKPLETDATARSEVFGQKGCLSTYANKIAVAYALGIIDKQARRDIDLVREVRNACAHSRLPISFSTPELQDAAKVVIGEDFLADLKDQEPGTLRDAFIVRCALLARYVGTGRRLSPLEAYQEALKEQAT